MVGGLARQRTVDALRADDLHAAAHEDAIERPERPERRERARWRRDRRESRRREDRRSEPEPHVVEIACDHDALPAAVVLVDEPEHALQLLAALGLGEAEVAVEDPEAVTQPRDDQ